MKSIITNILMKKRGCHKSLIKEIITCNLKGFLILTPLNPLKGTSKTSLKARFGGLKKLGLSNYKLKEINTAFLDSLITQYLHKVSIKE